jgi:tripartite-type tricarboxylate transporter receptor subunit TctC
MIRVKAMVSSVAAVLAALVGYVAVAFSYPTGVVTLVVPYAAGTGTDTFARIFARRLEAELGQRFIVENRPGANGMTGASFVARSKADGYTLLYTTNSTHTSIQGLYKSVPYDPVKDFTPISILFGGAALMVARADVPIESVPQLIAYAKANPNKLSIGFAGANGQIGIEVLKKRTGIEVVLVPYRGTPQAITDLLSGNLQLVVADALTAGPHVDAGKAKPVAYFAKSRGGTYPNTATLHETVAPGLDLSFWQAVYAPANAPKEVVTAISGAFRKALEHQEVTDQMKRFGLQMSWMGPDEFPAYQRAEIDRWNGLIKEAGIEPE